MQTMKTVFATAFILLATLCHAQTFTAGDEDSAVMEEYIDGKLWVYRNFNDIVVGTNCSEVKDSYGKYYQINILLHNSGKSSVMFCPEDVLAYLQRKNDTTELEVYTNEEFQKKIRRSQNLAMILYGISAGINASNAAYSTSQSTTVLPNGYAYTTTTRTYDSNAALQANMAASAQMSALSSAMNSDRGIIEQGYLKKNTIYPDQTIVGYMNIKRQKGNVLTVLVPIEGFYYSFDWDVSKKKAVSK